MLVIKCHNIEKLIIYCTENVSNKMSWKAYNILEDVYENVSNKMSQHWKAYNIL